MSDAQAVHYMEYIRNKTLLEKHGKGKMNFIVISTLYEYKLRRVPSITTNTSQVSVQRQIFLISSYCSMWLWSNVDYPMLCTLRLISSRSFYEAICLTFLSPVYAPQSKQPHAIHSLCSLSCTLTYSLVFALYIIHLSMSHCRAVLILILFTVYLCLFHRPFLLHVSLSLCVLCNSTLTEPSTCVVKVDNKVCFF